MALNIQKFALVGGGPKGCPKIFMYQTIDDSLATVLTDNYFDSKDLVDSVDIGDFVYISAGDKNTIAIIDNTGTDGTIELIEYATGVACAKAGYSS